MLKSISARSLETLFSTKEVNAAGIYVIYFYINGIRTSVVIDDFVPCVEQDGNWRPAFIRSKTQEIWAILVEKAWAKLHGTYARTQVSDAGFLRAHLSGIPYKSVIHSEVANENEMWKNFILTANKTNHLVKVLANGYSAAQFADLGLAGVKPGRCYEVKDACSVEHVIDGNLKGHARLVLLQTMEPGDKEIWAGPWGNNGPEWTYELREQHNLEQKTASGLFYLPFSDYLRLFRSTDVSFDQSDY